MNKKIIFTILSVLVLIVIYLWVLEFSQNIQAGFENHCIKNDGKLLENNTVCDIHNFSVTWCERRDGISYSTGASCPMCKDMNYGCKFGASIKSAFDIESFVCTMQNGEWYGYDHRESPRGCVKPTTDGGTICENYLDCQGGCNKKRDKMSGNWTGMCSDHLAVSLR